MIASMSSSNNFYYNIFLITLIPRKMFYRFQLHETLQKQLLQVPSNTERTLSAKQHVKHIIWNFQNYDISTFP